MFLMDKHSNLVEPIFRNYRTFCYFPKQLETGLFAYVS